MIDDCQELVGQGKEIQRKAQRQLGKVGPWVCFVLGFKIACHSIPKGHTITIADLLSKNEERPEIM